MEPTEWGKGRHSEGGGGRGALDESSQHSCPGGVTPHPAHHPAFITAFRESQDSIPCPNRVWVFYPPIRLKYFQPSPRLLARVAGVWGRALDFAPSPSSHLNSLRLVQAGCFISSSFKSLGRFYNLCLGRRNEGRKGDIGAQSDNLRPHSETLVSGQPAWSSLLASRSTVTLCISHGCWPGSLPGDPGCPLPSDWGRKCPVSVVSSQIWAQRYLLAHLPASLWETAKRPGRKVQDQPSYVVPVVLKVWSGDQEHHHHRLGAREESRLSAGCDCEASMSPTRAGITTTCRHC